MFQYKYTFTNAAEHYSIGICILVCGTIWTSQGDDHNYECKYICIEQASNVYSGRLRRKLHISAENDIKKHPSLLFMWTHPQLPQLKLFYGTDKLIN